jgi:hypothetical protein
MADLHTLCSSPLHAHKDSQPICSSLHTGAIQVSLNHTLPIPLHYRTHLLSLLELPPTDNWTAVYRCIPILLIELSTDNRLGRPSCLQGNSSARTTQKSQPLYCCRRYIATVAARTIYKTPFFYCCVRVCLQRRCLVTLWPNPSQYCDVTAESRNSGTRARRPLLSNGSEITFPLQSIAANASLSRLKF